MVTADRQESKDFFQKRWLEARAVSDVDAKLYKAFGLARGGAKEMFGLSSVLSGIRATFKGHTVGKPTGDPWRMGGCFLVTSELKILWSHSSSHAGDHPDLDIVVNKLKEWNVSKG